MNWPPLLLFAAALILTGCVSRAKARAQAQAAFEAGRQQALSQLRETAPGIIHVTGPVRNPQIVWSEGLTLAQLVVAADYTGAGDPSLIVVTRGAEKFEIDPQTLLKGKDFPLLPGDAVEIRP